MLSVNTDSRTSGINTRYLTETRGHQRADPKNRGSYHSKDDMTAIGKSSRRIAGCRAKVTDPSKPVRRIAKRSKAGGEKTRPQPGKTGNQIIEQTTGNGDVYKGRRSAHHARKSGTCHPKSARRGT